MALLRRTPWFLVPLGIFALTRLVDAVLIVVLARHQIPASSLPADMPIPTLVDPATYGHVIANWDGQWYRRIAEHGYPLQLPTRDGVVQQNAWAFYPGYPFLVRLLMLTGASFGLAASVVSLTAGAWAMVLLYSMLRERSGGDYLAAITVLALCCAPAAPAFQAAYTESLGLLLVVVGLRCLERRRYGGLLLVGLALAFTRPITAPLAVVAAAQFLLRWHRRDREPFPVRERWVLGSVTAALAGCAVVWPLVTGLVVGDLSAYSRTQRAWRSIAGNRPDTWLVSLLHGGPPGRWVVVALLLLVALAIAVRNRQWTHGTRVWTVAYTAFILATTPATSSILRYALLVGPAWWPFPGVAAPSVPRPWKAALLVVVAVLGIASQVVWLGWYFVITPDSRGTP